MSKDELDKITPEFKEMGVKDLPREFSVEINEMIQQNKLSGLKIYEVKLKNHEKPDEEIGFLAILTYTPFENKNQPSGHGPVVYRRDNRTKVDSLKSDSEIIDKFVTGLKY